MKFVALFLMLIFPMTSQMPMGGITANASTCPGIPSWTAQLLASSTAGGGAVVTTWADSTGNGHAMSGFNGSSGPQSNSSITPNGGKAVSWTNVAPPAQQGSMSSGVTPVSNSFTMCEVWKASSFVNTIIWGGGASTAPYADFDSGSKHLGIAGGTTPGYFGKSTATLVANTWYTSCETYNGSTYTFYTNGSADGSGSATSTITTAINLFFTQATLVDIAELDYLNTSINSTQAAAIHTCAVTAYGVP